MIQEHLRRLASLLTATALLIAAPGSALANGNENSRSSRSASVSVPTTTPIKNVVVIFQENISFDHYFATYPYATNPVNRNSFHCEGEHPPR